MAQNVIGTLYDDNGVAIASKATGKGKANYTSLLVSDDGTPILTSSGGSATTAIASGTASDTTVKATAGRLCRIAITGAAGTTTGQTDIWDNASGHTGTKLCSVLNNTAIGTVIEVQMPAANGITVQGTANSPAMTISYV